MADDEQVSDEQNMDYQNINIEECKGYENHWDLQQPVANASPDATMGTELIRALPRARKVFLEKPKQIESSGSIVCMRSYDVFISHCRADTKHTLAKTIYQTLAHKGLRVFLDREEQELSDSFPDVIQEAMRSCTVHIAIFSEKYADSPWCLEELSYMLQTGNRIIPVFYHVDPSDLRWAAKGNGSYALAFSEHEKRGKYSSIQLHEWKMALQTASYYSGHVLESNIGDEEILLKRIVNSVIIVVKTEQQQQKRMQIVGSSGNNQIVGSSGNNNNSTSVGSSVESRLSVHRHGPPRTSALEVNDRHIHRSVDLAFTFNWCALALLYALLLFNHPIIHRFANFASKLNSAALAFVLQSYGLVLSNPLFWMCWSILAMKVVTYNTIQPYWEWIERFTRTSDESEGTIRRHRARANILLSIAIIILLLCTHDITQRQNTILLITASSVLLFEGVTPILNAMRKEGLTLTSNPWGDITSHQKLKALIFLISSALNAMIGMTGPIVLTGDLGRLMPTQVFWAFTFIFLVEVLAHFFPRIVSGESSLSVTSTTHSVVVMLRLIVEGCLCWWMVKVIYHHSYFPSNLVINDCNELCRERSKHLLITMVALSGLQAIGTFIDYSLCKLPAHRQCPLLPLFSLPPLHIASS